MRDRILLASIALLTLAVPAGRPSARPSQQVPVGPRALAMGSAYSSIADDASAVFWNPAGLAWLGHQEISATHADLYGTGIQDNLVSFALALSPHSAAALDWYHSGFDDAELNFGESRIDLSYARRVLPFLSAGATVKYLDRTTGLDDLTVRQGHGAGFDLGLIATPLPRLRIGVLGQDMLDTNVSYSSGDGTSVAFPMNVRGGISYSPIASSVVAFDVDDRWHVGAEFRPIAPVALRAGLQNDWSGPDGMTWSAGAGIRAGLFRFDYALVDHPVLGATNHFGLAMEFNFNPSQVRIEKVEPKDLYASLHKTYARQPVATMRIRNLDDRPLTARVRVLIPELMNEATEQEVILRPRATEEVSLPALIGERAMERTDNRSVQVRVSATYQSARLPRTESANAKGVLYAPGAIDWNQGVDQAAAFITTRDPIVDALARDAARIAALSTSGAGTGRGIAFSAAIVDALASLNLAYVPDPNNPYSAISDTPHAVDTISYPRETLARGSGDCDDTSVLLASLLENVGIATKLVDVPGHIFLLADTGVHERNRIGLGLSDELTVVADRRVWIPLESTAIGKGFLEAWRQGSDSYAAWSARGRVALVDVERSFERYEPAEPPAIDIRPPVLDTDEIQRHVAGDLETVASWREATLASLLGSGAAESGPSIEALLEIARVQFGASRLGDARKTLEGTLERQAGNAAVLCNLGTVLASQGDLEGAARRYEEALTADEKDGGVWLNLGLVRYAMGDSTGAEVPLTRGLEKTGGYSQACALLALAPEPSGDREGGRAMTDAEARALLQKALLQVPRPGRTAGETKSPTPSPKSTASGTSAPTWQSRVAGGRSSDMNALSSHLYWKEH